MDLWCGMQEPRPHNFKTAQFFHPTFCAHCGAMIYGLLKQGVRCNDCGVTAHHRCKSLMPKSCGTDVQERRGRIRLAYYTERLTELEWRINVEGTPYSFTCVLLTSWWWSVPLLPASVVCSTISCLCLFFLSVATIVFILLSFVLPFHSNFYWLFLFLFVFGCSFFHLFPLLLTTIIQCWRVVTYLPWIPMVWLTRMLSCASLIPLATRHWSRRLIWKRRHLIPLLMSSSSCKSFLIVAIMEIVSSFVPLLLVMSRTKPSWTNDCWSRFGIGTRLARMTILEGCRCHWMTWLIVHVKASGLKIGSSFLIPMPPSAKASA